MLACGQRALAHVSYMGSTRAKARSEHKPNGPLFHRCVAPFYSGIDTYTLIETAKLNGVDPQAWHTDTLGRISGHKITKLDQLMPWNCDARE